MLSERDAKTGYPIQRVSNSGGDTSTRLKERVIETILQ
jgi:hypothetical protein